jgi:hypothetical protein
MVEVSQNESGSGGITNLAWAGGSVLDQPKARSSCGEVGSVTDPEERERVFG